MSLLQVLEVSKAALMQLQSKRTPGYIKIKKSRGKYKEGETAHM